MVSVDDLVISLRIDETSNLGNLQKQLTALVGKKGEKAVAIGLDPGFKRDMDIIKSKMMLLTHIAPGARRQPLIGQARAFFNQLRDATMFKNVLDKMGFAKEDLEDIMVTLGDIGEGLSPIKLSKISNFIKDVQIMLTQSPDLIGDVKSLATRLIKDIPEYIPQQRLQKIFQELGHSVRESGMFVTKLPVQVRDVLKKGVIDWTEETAKKFKEAGGDIEKLVGFITDIGDPIKAFEKAYPGVDLTKLVNITEEFEPYVAATIMAASDKQISILKFVYEYIRDKLGQTKVIGRVTGRQQYDFLVQGWDEIRKRFGGKLGLEQLSDNIKQIIKGTEAIEYEKVLNPEAVKELKERIKMLDHVILLVSSTNQNAPIYLKELEETAKLYGHTFEAWKVNMRRMEEQIDLAPTIKIIAERLRQVIKEEEKQKEEEEKKEEEISDEDKKFLKALEETNEEFKEEVEGIEKLFTGEIGKEDALSKENIGDVLDSLDDIKATTDDTNKEVKKKDNEPPVEKSDV